MVVTLSARRHSERLARCHGAGRTASGQVLEFLSYEGTITATDGAGGGPARPPTFSPRRTNAAIGSSLQRNSVERLARRRTSSFGACNPDRRRRSATPFSSAGRVPGRSGAAGGLRRPAASRRCAAPTNVDDPDHHHVGVGNAGIASIDAERRDARAGRGHGDVPRDGGRRHDGYLLAADARGGGERRRSIRATPSSVNPRTATPAMTSSCATSSSRRRTTRTAARPTG